MTELAVRDDVVAWRLHVLLASGYEVAHAEVLAKSDVDLHEAVELIVRGCPSGTAVRILL